MAIDNYEQRPICTAVVNMYNRLGPVLDEKQRRLFLAAASNELGTNGVPILKEETGVAESTIYRGRKELKGLPSGKEHFRKSTTPYRVRKEGAGRKKVEDVFPKILGQINEDRRNNTKTIEAVPESSGDNQKCTDGNDSDDSNGPQ